MSNTWRARREKSLKRLAGLQAGELREARGALRLIIADGVARLEQLDESDTAGFSRVATAITSACREFKELVGATELEERITAIESNQRNKTWSGARA